MLGPIPGAVYESAEERLRPGDTLVLFTDGVVERENEKKQPFGTRRLEEAIRSSAGASARGVVDTIFAAVDGYSHGASQQDDMTIVVVRKT